MKAGDTVRAWSSFHGDWIVGTLVDPPTRGACALVEVDGRRLLCTQVEVVA